MKTNELGEHPETDVSGFGQTAALFALGAVVFAILDQESEATEGHAREERGNNCLGLGQRN